MTTIAYCRCSTTAQDLDPQIEAMKAAGADQIFFEHESAVKRARPELERALAALKPGDQLLVTKIDRLARSLVDFCIILDRVKTAGASFRSIHDAVDTSSPLGRALVGILAVFAELERTRILERTQEGRTRAMARGVAFGPRKKLSVLQIAEARAKLEAGESATTVGALFRVSRQTIVRAVQ
jgi:DNA invertase Pin-like site-specific DNA recombinase